MTRLWFQSPNVFVISTYIWISLEVLVYELRFLYFQPLLFGFEKYCESGELKLTWRFHHYLTISSLPKKKLFVSYLKFCRSNAALDCLQYSSKAVMFPFFIRAKIFGLKLVILSVQLTRVKNLRNMGEVHGRALLFIFSLAGLVSIKQSID